jgi:asparagine synthase (glutamine-hydrolysing)
MLGIQQHHDETSFISNEHVVILFHSDINKHHTLLRKVLVPIIINSGKVNVRFLNNFASFSDGALALYQSRPKRLLLLTDVVGLRKIFYTIFDKTIFFSSSLKHIINFLQKIGRLKSLIESLDTYALKVFLAYGVTPINKTMIKGVFKLQLGSALFLELNNFKWKIATYHDLLTESSTPNIGVEKRLLEIIINNLLKSVKIRVEDSNGILISGGLDSAIIASILRRITSNILAVNVSYGPYSEVDLARRTANSLSIKMIEAKVKMSEMAKALRDSLSILDEPQFRSNFLGRYIGVKFLANKTRGIFLGEGGDEIFMGYWLDRWRWHKSPVAIFTQNLPISFPVPLCILLSRFCPSYLIRSHNLLYAGKNFDRALCAYFASNSLGKLLQIFPNARPLEFMDEGMLSKVGIYNDPVLKTSVFLYLMLMQSDVAIDENFSARLGIKLKLPYLDTDLIRVIFALSSKIKLKDGITKYLLRRIAMEYSDLPAEVAIQQKSGFPCPLKIGFSQCDFSELINDLDLYNKIVKKIKKFKDINLLNSIGILSMWLQNISEEGSLS